MEGGLRKRVKDGAGEVQEDAAGGGSSGKHQRTGESLLPGMAAAPRPLRRLPGRRRKPEAGGGQCPPQSDGLIGGEGPKGHGVSRMMRNIPRPKASLLPQLHQTPPRDAGGLLAPVRTCPGTDWRGLQPGRMPSLFASGPCRPHPRICRAALWSPVSTILVAPRRSWGSCSKPPPLVSPQLLPRPCCFPLLLPHCPLLPSQPSGWFTQRFVFVLYFDFLLKICGGFCFPD